jgi:putative ABC transport system permease protein
VRTWLARLAGLVRGRRREDDLQTEIETHLALLADEFERRGLPSDEAGLAASRAFGGVERTKVVYREQLRLPLVDALVQDARFALRLLARERGVALTAVLVLGLGLGVNNMMFTLIYGTTMRGLPIPDRDRVLHVSTFDKQFPDRPLTYPEFAHLRAHTRTFAGMAAFVNAPVAVSDDGRAADRFDATYLTANAMTLIGTAPALGRMFTANDDRPGAEPVAILGATAWEARYAGDPATVGGTILIDGMPTTVIGVMPQPSRFPTTAEVWLPLTRMPRFDPQNRDARTLRVVGRLSPVAAEADARTEMEELFSAFAGDGPSGDGLGTRVVPLNDRFFFSPLQPGWLAFCAAALLILIVTCANTANLMLSSTGRRAREIAVRTSLGASRRRIVGQILVECIVITALGGLVAAGVSRVAVRLFRSAIPSGAMPYWMDYSMDSRVLLALLVAAFLSVLLVGLVPALHASRTDVNRVLKDGGRAGSSRSSRRLTTVFLVAELAFAIVLAMQFAQSWQGAPRVPSDDAIETTAVLTASVTLPSTTYRAADERADFLRRLFDRLQGVDGVIASSAATAVPMGGAVEQRLDVDGTEPDPERRPRVATVSIGPRYFDALAVSLRRGRAFTDADGLPGHEAAIVNQRFVDMHLNDVNPIGHRIRLTPANAAVESVAWFTIVGVVEDIRQRPAAPDAVVYTPIRASTPATVSVLMRSRLHPADASAMLREQVMAIDPRLPLYRVMTLGRAIEDAQWNGRVSHRLITALTLLAVVVSIVGLYAVTSQAVNQRTQELGIRMALGARAADVRRLILRRAAFQAALGLLLGLAGSAWWSSAFFSGQQTPPPLVPLDQFLPVAVGLIVVTLGACAIPLHRATSLDPASVLREP